MTRPRALLSLAVGAFAAGMSALAVLQQEAFETGRFDVGNLTQAVWSTAHGRFLEMTDLQGVQFSRLGAHFDPLVALLVPPGDPVALAAAVRRLARDRVLADAIGAAGRETYAARASEAVLGVRWRALLERAIAGA